ncbi:MAG: 16S rRNA (guanine(966)-N(2))-methyltransferase RsmD [Deltaproteobacteria bacterium]|nr:16S rRNA (guanine(966)-N(2))-methyltransferase RsmD [Deltaproteobacteria bacterium]
MRVIAGSARGRKLKAPKGRLTRPTPGRVREALFSMILPEIKGARVLDLFAGTGALGIEALSRGAASATFVEKDRRVSVVLRQNLAAVGADATVVALEAGRAIDRLTAAGERFDIAFLDPPYASGLLEASLHRLAVRGIVRTLMVCEHSTRQPPPVAPVGWVCARTRAYGDVTLSLFRKGGAA